MSGDRNTETEKDERHGKGMGGIFKDEEKVERVFIKALRGKRKSEEGEQVEVYTRKKAETGARDEYGQREKAEEELPFESLFGPEPPLIQPAFNSLCEVL